MSVFRCDTAEEMESPAKREEPIRSERQIVLLPDFCPKHDFLVRKRKMPKEKKMS